MYRALKAEVASYAGSSGGSFPGLEIALSANCKRLVARFELLGTEKPGFSHQALESATRRPESATTEAESATRKPESATREPESATREPECATTPRESKSDDSSAFRDQDLPDPCNC